jgi:hypothetical protein
VWTAVILWRAAYRKTGTPQGQQEDVKKTVSKEPIYQVKITLERSKPPIWRRICVRGDVTLEKLHYIIQVAMGWTNSHLHQFIVGESYFGEPHPRLL